MESNKWNDIKQIALENKQIIKLYLAICLIPSLLIASIYGVISGLITLEILFILSYWFYKENQIKTSLSLGVIRERRAKRINRILIFCAAFFAFGGIITFLDSYLPPAPETINHNQDSNISEILKEKGGVYLLAVFYIHILILFYWLFWIVTNFIKNIFLKQETNTFQHSEKEKTVIHAPQVQTIKIIFATCSLIAFSFAVNNLAQIVDSVQSAREGKIIVPNDDRTFKNTILAKASKAALTLNFDDVIMQSLRDEDIVKAEIYIDLANYLNISLSPSTLNYYNEQKDFWNTSTRWLKKCVGGAILRDAENLEQIVCMIAIDTTLPLWGDIADTTIEGYKHYVLGEEADKLIIALSSLSLMIQGYEAFTEEEKDMTKSAVNMVGVIAKTSKGFKFSPKIQRQIKNLANNSINFDTMKITARGKEQFDELFSHSTKMLKYGRNSTPLVVLKYADEIAELPFYTRTAKIFGKQTDGILLLLGKGLKHSFFVAGKTFYKAKSALTGFTTLMIASMLSFILSISSFLTNRILRRWVLSQLEKT